MKAYETINEAKLTMYMIAAIVSYVIVDIMIMGQTGFNIM
ncbi:hypothetical protein Mcup_1009 [Metallosphaera cuprina Ar-4]|uniref:Uncharacterized protein n=1 Tax=Metallosphaera cuprina (strain Ar-4) TaxID=1006006 RepID=F4G2R6_METCR|nr:hypothetical protein Mcup_1009 [Metallosphaera cuprina Ar-4]